MRFPIRLAVLAALTVGPAACAPADAGDDADADPAAQRSQPPAPQVDTSAVGMVSSAHPLATEAGVRILEAGGNAADAAVATAFALAVVEPSMSGLGGRSQILVHGADGRLHGIDATTQAPATYDPETAPQADFGYATVGVPGVVGGLTRLHADHGSLPLPTVMEPAIRLASEGFPLLESEAERFAGAREELLESEGGRTYFLEPDSTTWAAGDRFVQEDLAATLRAIAEGGAEAFYRGEIAERIAADMEEKGGAVNLQALADYRAETVPVVRGDYRGWGLAGTWVPAYGAITIEALQILETVDPAILDDAAWAAAVGQAIDLAYDDRPDQHTEEDARRLTSKEWAARRADELELPVPAGVSIEGPASGRRVAAALPPSWTEDGHTTHLSTADSSGMAVALTQSLGPSMGSKVAAPGLGFLYAATLGGYLGDMEPGERARSHISPFMVLREGRPAFVLGAAGGSRIPSAIVAAISRLIDHDMPLHEALAAPRVYLDGEEVDLEVPAGLALDPSIAETLRGMGLEVETVEREGAFGRIHAVAWEDELDAWIGAADPDWQGSARGPDPRP